MTKLPDYLLPPNRKNAIHYLVKKIVPKSFFGMDTEMNAVACGQAIKDFTNRVATEPHRVTCRACYMICHPRPSMFEARK